MRICKKCVLPENFPHVTFDKKGVCNYCRAYKGRLKLERLKKKYKKDFEALVKKIKRRRGEYDILMCYSGGKDSTYALSILKNTYNLRVLAFTLDNGFIPERTYINIRNVIEKLGVDHIFFKPSFDILKKIFTVALKKDLYPAKSLERASAVCTSCMGLVKYSALKLAIEKDIPLIAFGWSPGQAPVTSSILEIAPAMIREMEKVLKNPMRALAGKEIDAYFLNERHYKADKFPKFVHPLAFYGDYNEKKILAYIKRFGWRLPSDVEMNATNCLLNPLADRAHIARHRFHPYLLEIAGFVREGYMSRKDGLKHLPVKKDERVIRMLKKRLGVR